MSECDVCGKTKTVGVACSALGAVSFAYCGECAASGAEPYGMLIGQMMSYEEYDESFRRIVDASLKAAGKTVADLNRDAREAFDEYDRSFLRS